MGENKNIVIVIFVCFVCFIGTVFGIASIYNDDEKVMDTTTTKLVDNENISSDDIDDVISTTTVENTTNIIDDFTTTTSESVISTTSKVISEKTTFKSSATTVTTNAKKSTTTKKKTTTAKKKTTTKKTTTTTKKYVVSTETEEVESAVTHKYGVRVATIDTYTVTIYSDGTVERKKKKTTTEYDRSGYKASTKDLKGEAQSLVSKNKSVYTDVLNYTNNYRTEKGIQNLTLSTELSVAATVRALEIAWAGLFSHARPATPNDLDSCFTVFDDVGLNYRSAGENIAYGQSSAKNVTIAWRNSPGHYQNMITENFNKLGVGMVELDGRKYWVQLFMN